MNDKTHFHVEPLAPQLAQKLCYEISQDLPASFDLPLSDRYVAGMLQRSSFAIKKENEDYVGLLTLEFPYPLNANIYWVGIKSAYQGIGLGEALIHAAWGYALAQGAKTLSVATVSLKESDNNYKKTYRFFEKLDFIPLLDTKPEESERTLVHMQKRIGFKDYRFIDLTHTLNSQTPSWNGHCGFEHQIKLDYAQCQSNVKFRVQQIKMHAGIGTHLDAPSHCFPNGLSAADLVFSQLIAPCIVIDMINVHEKTVVSIKEIAEFEKTYGRISGGCFVILNTGWSKFWPEPKKYRNELVFPTISAEAVEFLLERGIVGLGIDTLSPDSPDSNFPAHRLLLSNGKYIVENVANASLLPPKGGYTLTLPLKVADGTEAPVRMLGLLVA